MDFEEIMQDESTQVTVGQRPSDFVTEEKLDVDLSQNIQFHHLDLNNIDPNHFPFWNNQVQEWAQKLPGCQKEDFIPSSICPLNMKRKPWFTFSYSTQKQKNSTSSSAHPPVHIRGGSPKAGPKEHLRALPGSRCCPFFPPRCY